MAKGTPEQGEQPLKAPYEAKALSSTSDLLKIFYRLASALIGFAVLAYILGVMALLGYCDALSVIWIEPLFPETLVLRRGVPLVMVVLFLVAYAGLTSTRTRTRYTTLQEGSRGWAYIAVGFSLAALVILFIERPLISHRLSTFGFVCALTAAQASLLGIYGNMLERSFRWTVKSLLLAGLAMTMAGAVFPWQVGRAFGAMQRNPDSCKLAYIVSTREEDANLRLLFVAGDQFYAVQLAEDGTPPVIHVLSQSEIITLGSVRVGAPKNESSPDEATAGEQTNP